VLSEQQLAENLCINDSDRDNENSVDDYMLLDTLMNDDNGNSKNFER
jgi:hypothetical protein